MPSPACFVGMNLLLSLLLAFSCANLGKPITQDSLFLNVCSSFCSWLKNRSSNGKIKKFRVVRVVSRPFGVQIGVQMEGPHAKCSLCDTFLYIVASASPSAWNASHPRNALPNALRWHLSISKLLNYLRKSKLCCPPALNRPAATYFTSKHSDELKVWLDEAKLASDVRWATILDSFAKATFRNQENWRCKIAEADSVLDKQVLEAVLGKRLPKQQMWDLSGAVTIGISLELRSYQLLSVITYLQGMSSTHNVVRVLIHAHSLQL